MAASAGTVVPAVAAFAVVAVVAVVAVRGARLAPSFAIATDFTSGTD
jgi:hypothetical protein